MTQSKALWLSAALTAFVLIIVGSVAGQVLQVDGGSQNKQTQEADPLQDPEVQGLLAERELAYQELVRAANEQLEKAYNENAQLAAQLAGFQGAVETTAFEVSPELAVGLALSLAPGSSLLSPPEVVLYQGSYAYEVTLDRGTIYIGAENGWLLFDGTKQSAPPSWDGHEHDDDHEEDD